MQNTHKANLIEVAIRTLCSHPNDAENTAIELDRAVKSLGGYREQILEKESTWDSWFFPEDKYYLLTFFITHSKVIFKTRGE